MYAWDSCSGQSTSPYQRRHEAYQQGRRRHVPVPRPDSASYLAGQWAMGKAPRSKTPQPRSQTPQARSRKGSNHSFNSEPIQGLSSRTVLDFVSERKEAKCRRQAAFLAGQAATRHAQNSRPASAPQARKRLSVARKLASDMDSSLNFRQRLGSISTPKELQHASYTRPRSATHQPRVQRVARAEIQEISIPVEVEQPEKLIVVTDVGQDNDDEMALLLLSQFARAAVVEPLAVIANLIPSERRAALARGTLDMIGLSNVPVGIGTHGGSDKHTDTFSQTISKSTTGVDYLEAPLKAVSKFLTCFGKAEQDVVSREGRIYDGKQLFWRVLDAAAVGSVTLLLLSSQADAATWLGENESIFVSKIKRVVIMGGGTVDSENAMIVPDDAHNNAFNPAASSFFYRRCQELGVPLVVLSRFAAYGSPMERKVYDLMVRCPVPNPVACRLCAAQRTSIERLWHNACVGGILPARCNRQWFCDTFCGGRGYDRSPQESIWDLIQTFNMYDPLALLACIPAMRQKFFTPREVVGMHGVTHCIIGCSKEENGINPATLTELKSFLLAEWMAASGRPNVLDVRPEHLSQGLTAALEPMAPHSVDEMNGLNFHVINLLKHEWLQFKSSSLLETWRDRDRLIKEIGPPMVLLSWKVIEDLGRIPHSSENRGISMEEAALQACSMNKRFFIEMFSHRWHQSCSPDDRDNGKARILVEWGKYRLAMGLLTFFWIDYTCINQSDIAPGVAMLPLYVSSCNNILCYDTPSYERRAWCRVERLLFVAFVAPNVEYTRPGFIFDPVTSERLPNGELKPRYEGKMTAGDPTDETALLTYKSDLPLIADLKALCVDHWAMCWKDGLMNIAEEKGGLASLSSLRFGKTTVRVRWFN
eukprot:TRINITY_DN8116_c0_g1_i1.p1 TRINITY_DN8116_c0_g1~~TRINITY_DN8116_c0_g1_i1.p1  ORF type:complete len:876 (+),score=111.98 TRINITY_DN8116_c0_g1_i1:70-2697(+)